MGTEEISILWKQIGAVKRKQKEKQAKQFEGYFEKLGNQGGYMTKKMTKSHKYGQMTVEQKVRHLERLDDEDGEDDDEFIGFAETSGAPGSALKLRMPQGEGDEAVEFNLAEVMAARQGETEL